MLDVYKFLRVYVKTNVQATFLERYVESVDFLTLNVGYI